eukprot:TRINITY_DN10852_c0_g2_i3.p1 TRINITY_DN10852_c0_g2~~TRINITY_DN10852_c0_g2_i3.p1  ORF type:complete len:498 (-),score=125.40 TRINITY_DN10852_c0_g2_i3:17-1510(-)
MSSLVPRRKSVRFADEADDHHHHDHDARPHERLHLDVAFYGDRLPEIEEVVMVRVVRSIEGGLTVALLEFRNLEGFVPLEELSSRRHNLTVAPGSRPGDTFPAQVLKLSTSGGSHAIDLSKKVVKERERQRCKNRYTRAIRLQQYILRPVARQTQPTQPLDAVVTQLVQTVLWPLYRDHGDAARALRLCADWRDSEKPLRPLGLPLNVRVALVNVVRKHCSDAAASSSPDVSGFSPSPSSASPHFMLLDDDDLDAPATRTRRGRHGKSSAPGGRLAGGEDGDGHSDGDSDSDNEDFLEEVAGVVRRHLAPGALADPDRANTVRADLTALRSQHGRSPADTFVAAASVIFEAVYAEHFRLNDSKVVPKALFGTLKDVLGSWGPVLLALVRKGTARAEEALEEAQLELLMWLLGFVARHRGVLDILQSLLQHMYAEPLDLLSERSLLRFEEACLEASVEDGDDGDDASGVREEAQAAAAILEKCSRLFEWLRTDDDDDD